MVDIRILRLLCLIGFLLLIAPFYQQCVGMKQVEAPAEEAPVTENGIPIPIDTVASTKQNDTAKQIELQFAKDSVAEIKTQDSINRVTPFYQKIYQAIDCETNENAFEMAYQSFIFYKTVGKEPKKFWQELQDDLRDKRLTNIEMPIRLTVFVFIDIFTILGLLFCFLDKFRWVHRLSKCNIILLFIALGCIFLEPMFEKLDQIKWGFYVFTLIQFSILILSQRISRQTLSD